MVFGLVFAVMIPTIQDFRHLFNLLKLASQIIVTLFSRTMSDHSIYCSLCCQKSFLLHFSFLHLQF